MSPDRRNKKQTLFLFAISAALLWSATFSFSAHAEFVKFDREKLFAPPTSSEDIILDFIKLAKIQSPEFEKMIVKEERYRATPDVNKTGFLQDEMLRLNKKYLTIDPGKNGILVRVAIKVYFDNLEGVEPKLTIKFPSDGLIYFPYYYGGLPVAVLINGIEDFQTIYLSEEERKMVIATIDPVPQATLILDLKPLGVSQKPIILDGEQQFPLICSISYIGIHNKNSDQVWGWKAQTDDKQDSFSPLGGIGPSQAGMEEDSPSQ